MSAAPRKVQWPLVSGHYVVENLGWHPTEPGKDALIHRVIEVVVHTEAGYHQAGRWLGPGTFYWTMGDTHLRPIEDMAEWKALRFIPLDLPAIAAAYLASSPV